MFVTNLKTKLLVFKFDDFVQTQFSRKLNQGMMMMMIYSLVLLQAQLLLYWLWQNCFSFLWDFPANIHFSASTRLVFQHSGYSLLFSMWLHFHECIFEKSRFYATGCLNNFRKYQIREIRILICFVIWIFAPKNGPNRIRQF